MAALASTVLFILPALILQALPIAAVQVGTTAEVDLSQTGPFDWVMHLFRDSMFGSREASKPRELVKTAKVELFYETLCPDCLDLLNTSVRELFDDKELHDRVELKMYPFGNALVLWNVSEGYHFWHENVVYPIFKCQHSDPECLGNMIQACAIDHLKTTDAFAPFAMCMASYGRNTGVELSSYACGKKLGVDMEAIKKCTYGRTGTQLMTDIGNKSMDPALKRDHVPWVLINGVHEPDAEDGKFLEAICNVLEAPKPARCSGKSAGVAGAGCGGGGGHC